MTEDLFDVDFGANLDPIRSDFGSPQSFLNAFDQLLSRLGGVLGLHGSLVKNIQNDMLQITALLCVYPDWRGYGAGPSKGLAPRGGAPIA